MLIETAIDLYRYSVVTKFSCLNRFDSLMNTSRVATRTNRQTFQNAWCNIAPGANCWSEIYASSKHYPD